MSDENIHPLMFGRDANYRLFFKFYAEAGNFARRVNSSAFFIKAPPIAFDIIPVRSNILIEE